MRVMFLSGSAALGGAERSLLDILASLRAAQPSWALHLAAAAEGPLVTRANALGVTTEVLPFEGALSRLGETGGIAALGAGLARASLSATRYLAKLKALLAARSPEIVHTNSLKMHVLAARARPGALVWHLHDYIGARRLSSRLLRWNAAACAAAVANSESVAADARKVLGPSVPITAIHNAVDLERFSVSGDALDLDALAGLPPPADAIVRVGLVGTFAHWKGHTTFLDALSRLPADLNVRGYVVGGALYQTTGSQYGLDDLKRRAEHLGLNGRVGFTGFVEHPERALRALDIVVHASTAPEPFGLVIAEAMACGRAVIASELGGASEVFTPGVDALSHAPGNADSLAARLVELARDGEARRRLGVAGRRTAEQRFDRRRLAANLLPVYERVSNISFAASPLRA
jgi:glycosyltransferase involved in cell wall biosynthesis